VPQERTVRTVESAEADRVLSTLTTAFIADPLFRWAFPDAANFLDAFPKLIQAYAGSGIGAGTAYCVGDFAGASIWLSPGNDPDEEATVGIVQSLMRPDRIEEFAGVMGELDNYHPHDEPLWYLPVIGVDAIYQGSGLGSAMLAHTLELCDEAGTRAYLESSNPANISLYERHGFEVMGRIEVGSAPPVHPMLREKP
jgi:ribosomal protein S18 acetylase RimI-like enzyme